MRREVEKEEFIEDEELDKTTSRMLTILRTLVFTIVPILLFYLMEAFEHNAFEEVRSLAQVYNILLFELIAWLLFFITGSGTDENNVLHIGLKLGECPAAYLITDFII